MSRKTLNLTLDYFTECVTIDPEKWVESLIESGDLDRMHIAGADYCVDDSYGEDEPFNCYVAAVATDEEDARHICKEAFHGEPLELIHQEDPTEEGELPTWVFTFWADSIGGDASEWEYLWDHFTIPQWPNLHYEVA